MTWDCDARVPVMQSGPFFRVCPATLMPRLESAVVHPAQPVPDCIW